MYLILLDTQGAPSPHILVFDASQDEFEKKLESAIYNHGDFAAISIVNFGSTYLKEYSSIFCSYSKLWEELSAKEFGKFEFESSIIFIMKFLSNFKL